MRNACVAIVSAACWLACAAPARAQDEWTYQGWLKDGGAPADGRYDFIFSLHDAPVDGSRVGIPFPVNDWPVREGLVTVELDFGAAAFNGGPRWLEVQVRPASNGNYVVLVPRQPLTAVPYALGLSLPLAASSAADGDLIRVTSTGNNADCAQFEITDPTNQGEAVEAQIAGSGNAIQAITTGTGRAGYFENANAANRVEALRVATSGASGRALFALATSPNGVTEAVRGQSDSSVGRGVTGHATAATGFNIGVLGQSDSSGGAGVFGYTGSPTGNNVGVFGSANSPSGFGVYGLATNGTAVRGEASAATGVTYGVYGSVSSPTGYAGYFVGGQNHFQGRVGLGTAAPEVMLHVTGGSDTSRSGGGYLVAGDTGGTNISIDNNEIMARSNGSVSGLYLNAEGGNVIIADNGAGRLGVGTSNPQSTLDVYGNGRFAGNVNAQGLIADGGDFGTVDIATSAPTLALTVHNGTNGGIPALYAQNDAGGLAARFVNDVHVVGNLSKGGGDFKIDHPLDPANKYLHHSFVESPDMLNVYSGIVVTDERGYADVILPDWFEALNRDFRYQLTVLDESDADRFVHVKVVRKVAANRFTLRTSEPAVEVSWQITGIRRDPWAEAHRIPVEEDKPHHERGFYLHPELYGEPPERRIGRPAERPAAPTDPQHEEHADESRPR